MKIAKIIKHDEEFMLSKGEEGEENSSKEWDKINVISFLIKGEGNRKTGMK